MELSPKEKAKELVDRFLNMEFGILKEYLPNHIIIAKQCALICVDETIKRIRGLKISGLTIAECNKYSRKVKQEIEKL